MKIEANFNFRSKLSLPENGNFHSAIEISVIWLIVIIFTLIVAFLNFVTKLDLRTQGLNVFLGIFWGFSAKF